MAFILKIKERRAIIKKIKIFALGGLNEEGKNMYVVMVGQEIFIFDAGLKYAADHLFGIDYIIPDLSYLKKQQDQIVGIFLTHGHDENIGALPEIIKEIPNLKIYGTKFTLDIVKKMLEADNIKNFNNLIAIMPHRKINFKENSIFPIRLTHSIPDNVGYVLYTEQGSIFYTGNFVFDPTMTGPYKTDIGKLAYIGKQGVLCLLSESVYAEKKGFTSPNHRVSNLIRETLDKNPGRLIFNVASANMYRVQEIFSEVMKRERKVVIMGKGLQRMITNLINMKYMKFNQNKIGTLSNINDRDAIILISSEKEKPFSNLNRIVNGYDKFIKISENDTVVFLEPIQDNQERLFVRISDAIARLGGNVISLPSRLYLEHHASSEDLMLMLDLIQPKYYFPVMGQYRYQVANAKLAAFLGINKDNILLKQNGAVVCFENGVLKETGEQLAIEDILIDGTSVGDIGELVLRDREMLSTNGIVLVSATVDRKTKTILAGPEILTRGFVYVKDNAVLIKEMQKIALVIIKRNTINHRLDFNQIKRGIREEVGKYLYKETGRRPMILTVVLEI